MVYLYPQKTFPVFHIDKGYRGPSVSKVVKWGNLYKDKMDEHDDFQDHFILGTITAFWSEMEEGEFDYFLKDYINLDINTRYDRIDYTKTNVYSEFSRMSFKKYMIRLVYEGKFINFNIEPTVDWLYIVLNGHIIIRSKQLPKRLKNVL